MTKHRVIVPGGLPPSPGARRVTIGSSEWTLTVPDLRGADGWTWRPHGWVRRVWTLDAGTATVLAMHPLGSLHREWRAEGAAGAWHFSSSWAGHVTVQDGGSGAVLFTHHRTWLGRGRIETPTGETLVFRRHWLLRYALETPEGYELLAIARAPGILAREHLVTLSEPVRRREDLLPLVALAWRLTLAARRRHAH